MDVVNFRLQRCSSLKSTARKVTNILNNKTVHGKPAKQTIYHANESKRSPKNTFIDRKNWYVIYETKERLNLAITTT